MRKNIINYYKQFCWAMAGLCAYFMLLPAFSVILSRIAPRLVRCAFFDLTGMPCPFCGGTSYLKALYAKGITREVLSSPFFIILLFIVLELISRIVLLFGFDRWMHKKAMIICDIVFHGLFIIYLIVYFLFYFLSKS